MSEAIVDQAHDVLGVPRARLSVIPNGRDPGTYRPPTGDESRADPPLVLFVGQLEPGKRPGLFLDVVEVLRSGAISFDAVIVGDGPLRADLRTVPRLWGYRCSASVPMSRDCSVEHLSCVMTSDATTEGMPGVLIEAGLSGHARGGDHSRGGERRRRRRPDRICGGVGRSRGAGRAGRAAARATRSCAPTSAAPRDVAARRGSRWKRRRTCGMTWARRSSTARRPWRYPVHPPSRK